MNTRLSFTPLKNADRGNTRWIVLAGLAMSAIAIAVALFLFSRRQTHVDQLVKPQARVRRLSIVGFRRSA